MSDQWWEFWDVRESMFGVEFVIRCKECGEFFAVRSPVGLPDECPGCKSKVERRGQ